MLITRYLFKNLLTVTVFIAITLTMVIWLTQSLKLLEIVANSDAPPSLLLKLVALTLPRFLEIILPVSLVTAILFVYHKMIMDNELIVLRACGFDQFGLAKPALIMAFGITAIVLALTTYVSPKCVASMQMLKQTVKSEYSSFLLREGIFNTFGKDLTVYVRRRTNDGDLTGLMIHDTRDAAKPAVTITAKRGRLYMEGSVPKIIVYDGMRQQLERDGGTTSKLFFSSYAIEIKGFEGSTEKRWQEPSERTLFELFKPNLSIKRDRNSLDLFKVEIHNRLVTPFNTFAFSMICLVAVLLGGFNRRGQSRKIILGALLVVLLQAINLAMISSAKKHIEMLPFLYIFTFLPILGGAYLLTFKGEQNVMALLRQWRNRKQSRELAGAAA